MKNVLFWFIIAFCFIQTYAQNSNWERRVYKVWIALNNQEDLKGYLTELNETSVVIVEDVGIEPKEIEISSIERLKFRSKGKIGRGIAIGAGAGLVLGVIGGYSSWGWWARVFCFFRGRKGYWGRNDNVEHWSWSWWDNRGFKNQI